MSQPFAADVDERPRRRTGPARLGGYAVICAVLLTGGCALREPRDFPTPQEIETTVYLIGDAGEPDPRQVGAALDSLSVIAAANPERSIIVFLGDNVYPAGIPEEGAAEWADARRRLAAQVRAVPPGARGIFIPGNHDWAYHEPFGLYSIRLQEDMITALADGRDVRMMPSNGCPGPVVLDVGRLRLIVLDTQWWLHDYIVSDEESDCEAMSVREVTSQLRAVNAPDGRENRVTLVAGHHPLMTGGEHGGYCGTTAPYNRFGGRSQDIVSSANRTLRDSIETAIRPNPPLAYVAGHDHNLQVLRGGQAVQYILVSGAGSYAKASCAVRLRESYYVSQHRSGFMRLDIVRGGGVMLSVYRYRGDGSGGRSYSRWLEPRP